jgi:hypothetical protein
MLVKKVTSFEAIFIEEDLLVGEQLNFAVECLD